MAVPCMPADVLLWRGQALLTLATTSADQISFNAGGPGRLLQARQGRSRRPALGRPGRGSGHVVWASDSSCWRAGVAPARARRDRACVPGGRRDLPGVSRGADATAVTLGEFRQAVAGVCCAPNESERAGGW